MRDTTKTNDTARQLIARMIVVWGQRAIIASPRTKTKPHRQ
jgi:hypothetical protein